MSHQPQKLQSITFAILADHFHSRGVKMNIDYFPAVKMRNFYTALKQDIDNYAIVAKNALSTLIRTQFYCKEKPTIYRCEFADKFKPQWLCYLNILHALMQLLDRNKHAEAWTRASDLWRHTIGTIVTIEFFHHNNTEKFSFGVQDTRYWGDRRSHDRMSHLANLYLYRKYIVASACISENPVNLIFPQTVGDTMNDMHFTDPIYNGQSFAVAQVTLTNRLFNIRFAPVGRPMLLYYPLQEDQQMIRYEKFYSKQSDQWRMEDEDRYHCREWDNLVDCFNVNGVLAIDGPSCRWAIVATLPIDTTDIKKDLYTFERNNVLLRRYRH